MILLDKSTRQTIIFIVVKAVAVVFKMKPHHIDIVPPPLSLVHCRMIAP